MYGVSHGGVGGSSIDTETYATDAGLAGDTDLYGNSTKSYGSKTWTAYNGNVTEDGFSNYAWDVGPTALNFGESRSHARPPKIAVATRAKR